MKNIHKAIAILEQLADPNHQPNGTQSICSHLIENRISMSYLFTLFKKWPEFSGELMFPVPSRSVLEPQEQYRYCYTYGRLWFGEYGAARRRLAAFLAKELREAYEC